MAQLKEYKDWQKEDQIQKGDLFEPMDKVFTGEFGGEYTSIRINELA